MDALSLYDELQAIAREGLYYADDPYDEERYERILELASEGYGEALELPTDRVREELTDGLAVLTPFVGVKCGIFDKQGRALMMKRADTGEWDMPGGAVDTMESPDETAVRETNEETGLDVRVIDHVGVYYVPPNKVDSHSSVILTYLCDRVGGELTLSHEGTQLEYVDPTANDRSWSLSTDEWALDLRSANAHSG
jgi:8-oxo-dGTP pyrophosphatase MutT (NUDIX family)